jgi:ubiquitin-conjugating enzyme E2 A
MLSENGVQLYEEDRREYNRRVREVVEQSWMDGEDDDEDGEEEEEEA